MIELAKQDKAINDVRGWAELSRVLGVPYFDTELGDQLMLTYNTERLRDRPGQENTR
jgi:hypothetical protein